MTSKLTRLVKRFVSKSFSPKYLLLTNAALGASFMSVADVLQQNIEMYMAKERKKLDTERTKSMMGGGLFFAVAGHYWYQFLDKRFPGHSKRNVLKKLACEIPAGPPFNLAFFCVVGTLQGKSVEANWKNFKDNLLWICLADWAFYVPMQTFNFLYLPPHFRFFYVACLNLVYDTFLSFVFHKDDVPCISKSESSLPSEEEKQKTSKKEINE